MQHDVQELCRVVRLVIMYNTVLFLCFSAVPGNIYTHTKEIPKGEEGMEPDCNFQRCSLGLGGEEFEQ